MDTKRAQTLDALAAFIEQQRAVLARTQSDVHTLRELKAEAVARADVGALAVQLSSPAFRLSERAADIRGPASASELEIGKIDWALFAQKDPHPLQHLALAKRTAHAARTAFLPPHSLPPPALPPPPHSSASTTSRTRSGSTASTSASHIPPPPHPNPLSANLPKENTATGGDGNPTKLSSLQSLVRTARLAILDPVFARLALDAQNDEDEEDVAIPEASSPVQPKHTISPLHARPKVPKNPVCAGGENGAAGRMPPRGPSGLFTRRASAAHKELQARQAIADAQHSTLLPRKSDGMEVDGEDDDDGSSTAVGECPSPPVSASALVKGGNAKPKEKAMSDFGGKYAKSTSRTVSVNDKDGDAMQHEGRPVRARRGTEKIKAQEEEHASASPAVGGGAEVGMRRRSSRTVPAPVPLRAESPQEQQLKRGVGRPSKPKVQPALESKQEESTPAPRRLSLRVKPPTRPPLKEEEEESAESSDDDEEEESEEESEEGSEEEEEGSAEDEEEATPTPQQQQVLGKRKRREDNASAGSVSAEAKAKAESSLLKIRINLRRRSISVAGEPSMESVSAPPKMRTRTRSVRTASGAGAGAGISTRTRTRSSAPVRAASPPPTTHSPLSTNTNNAPAPLPTRTTLRAKRKEDKGKADTYKVMWSVEEQNLLERLLEEIPKEDPRRYLKISQAMEGRRTPRQVSSRVQKYLQKLRKFGLEVE